MGREGVGDNLLPEYHSIWLTALFAASGVVVIVLSIYLYCHRATTFVRRKSWPLFLASNVGIIMVYISQIVYLWVYWEAVRGTGVVWWTGQSFYYMGFVMCFFTLGIRSWRIVCIFSTTLDVTPGWPPCKRETAAKAGALGDLAVAGDVTVGARTSGKGRLRCNLCRFSWATPFTRRARGNWWTAKRVIVTVFPAFFITLGLFPFGAGHFAEQLWTWYDLVAILFFLAVFWRLFQIRNKVALEELLETKMLLVFSCISVFYFVVDNLLWFLVIRPLSTDDPHHVLKFWTFELFQVVVFDALFCTTTGYTCYCLLRYGGASKPQAVRSHASSSVSSANPVHSATVRATSGSISGSARGGAGTSRPRMNPAASASRV